MKHENTTSLSTVRPSRRTLLKAAGVALTLPALEAFSTNAFANNNASPKRIVTICSSLGLHRPAWEPKGTGKDYTLSKYLEHIGDFRDRFTVFSGLSHPEQGGANGHSSEMTWLTAAPHPGLAGFRNTISLDQLISEQWGYETRFPSLILSTAGAQSQSYTRGGVMLPAEHSPSELFQKLFLNGRSGEVEFQKKSLANGRSVLDSLGDQTKQLHSRVSAADRHRLDEYFQSLRTAENNLREAQAWLNRPKPVVDAEQPTDIVDENDLIGRTRLIFDLVPLILQTDSTRMVSILVHGRSNIPKVKGVKEDHHNLSHHGQNLDKIAQLIRIENEFMKSFNSLLSELSEKKEASGSLLDNTMVLLGSNLGNANSHDWRNLPILLAGGGFKHGEHVAFNRDQNQRLSNLFVTMMQKAGLEVNRFGSSNGTLDW